MRKRSIGTADRPIMTTRPNVGAQLDLSKLTASVDSSEELRAVRSEVSVTMLTFTSRVIAAAAVGVILLGLVDGGAEVMIAGVLGGIGSVAAAIEARREEPDVGRVLMAWILILACVVPLLPPLATLALAVPLATTAFMAGLLLGRRSTRWVIAITGVVLVWQLLWLGVTGTEISMLTLIGVIQALGVTSGLIIIRLTRTSLLTYQDRYQSLFNSVPVGLYRSDREGNILAANRRLVEMLGFDDLRSLLATNANDLYFDSSDRQRALALIEQSDFEEVLFRLRKADGTPMWARDTAHTVFDEEGKVLGYEGVLEDVTVRTEAESWARRAEERFGVAFESAPIGMALVTMRGDFERVNRAFCELVGSTASELRGMNWRDITPSEDEGSSAAPVREMEPGDSIEIERRFLHSSGELRWGRVSLSMFETGSDREPNLVVQLADITPQKLLQEHLENLVRAKDEFVASVSHELRTPLTAVLGLTRELVDNADSFDPAEARELLQLVAEQSTDVAHIVEDLLVAARADIGELSISPEIVDIGAEIRLALRECDHLVKGRELRVAGDDENTKAFIDPVRLRQILRNLLTNAFRYGGPEVEIEIVEQADFVTIRVKDNGEGLPQREWEAIFLPYHRAHDPAAAVGSIGLGLAVSKRLAIAMGGDLRYHYEGHHSIFELTVLGSS